MIIQKSDSFIEIGKTLQACLDSENYKEWAKIFSNSKNNAHLDGFINFLSLENSNSILESLGFGDIKEWFYKIDDWSEKIYDPLNNSNPESLILHQLWQHLLNNLIESIRNTKLLGEIPLKGGIICYLDGMSKCAIFKYEIISSYPKFQFIDLIENPLAVFDFWSILDKSDLKQKNVIKEIISSGHKLVYQRGVLIHVDRRKDIGVFGPTIDTILITEILSQQVFENNDNSVTSALEIGCGNGLITVSMAKNCKNLTSIKSIDVDFNSVCCCERNLRANISSYKYGQLNKHIVYGKFNKEIFNTKFDLVVCNPPYIPSIDNSFQNFHNKRDYFQAVVGLDLIDEILLSLSDLLSSNGKLLLLVSSVSLDYTLNKIPEGYQYDFPIKDGFEVIFDVEAVFNNKPLLNYLLLNNGVEERENVYYHKLFPIWISKN